MDMTAAGDGRARAPRSAPAASSESPRERQQLSPAMIEMAGGVGAPARARRWVRSCLASEPIGSSEADVVVVVSELVTNSVVHAHADSSQLLRITVGRSKDGLRIAVTDGGSETVPHLRDSDAETPGGLGLRIIDRLCMSWGVIRSGTGTTEVWCDVAVGSELN